MTAVRILITCLFLTVLPFVVGDSVTPTMSRRQHIVLSWVLGQVILWAGFFAVSIPMILMGKDFSMVQKLYGIFIVCAVGVFVLHGILRKSLPISEKNLSAPPSKAVTVLWVIAVFLFLVQLFCIFFLAYEEGDDAYYVSVTTINSVSDSLYTIYPYTGFSTNLTVRYALAPFPVWVALLSRISGLSGATTAHVLMPVFILLLTYAVYYLIGCKLLDKELFHTPWMMPAYLCLVELAVIFGGYSTYTRENFLLVRAGQGKAVLSNVVLPLVFYLLMLLYERLEKKEKTGFLLWLLCSATMAAGCLCSTLGSLLLCILLGLGGLCGAIFYRRWGILVGILPSFMISAMVVFLYLR